MAGESRIGAAGRRGTAPTRPGAGSSSRYIIPHEGVVFRGEDYIMNTVEPIRDLTQIDDVKNILKSSSIRDYLLFVMGINTGLRISDLFVGV